MAKTFFTADHHFGHSNIIRYCERPYNSADEMDAAYITIWNQTVSECDTVFHLGDFALANRVAHAANYFQYLNGDITLVVGNHDRDWAGKVRDVIISKTGHILRIRHQQLTISVDGLTVVLSHHPLQNWRNQCVGGIHLHGHSHNKSGLIDGRLDVGVDSVGPAPITIPQALRLLRGRKKAGK